MTALLPLSHSPWSLARIVDTADQDTGRLDEFALGLTNSLERLHQAAAQDSLVFITGEHGTGKARLAEVIHKLSPRRDKPFVTVNCASRSSRLIEVELFGCVGGVEGDREGKLAAAGGGTLLLDEIEALALPLQHALLSAVTERIFKRVGSPCRLPLLARIIVISTVGFGEEPASASIHADLLRHPGLTRFHLPALRDSRASIPLLAKRFLSALGTPGRVCDIEPAAMEALMAYDWPGNIRELFNVMERSAALARSTRIELQDLPEAITSTQPVNDG